MNVYFACSPSPQHIGVLSEEKVKNVLFSYHYVNKPERLSAVLGEYKPERIIIDSGAFTVWSNGGKIDLKAYGQFGLQIKNLLPKEIELNIVNLDVLPGKWGFVPSKEEIDKSAKQGWQNMLYLESLGLKVIHVFHQHEDWEVLDALTKHSDYIGISPANDESQASKTNWMNQVFTRLDVKKSKVKTHGFAVTSYQQVYQYPYYSVDSSSWIAPAIWGRLTVMDDAYRIKSFSYKDINDLEKYWPLIRSMGYDKISAPQWQDRTRIAIRAYQKMEEVATRLQEQKGLIW